MLLHIACTENTCRLRKYIAYFTRCETTSLGYMFVHANYTGHHAQVLFTIRATWCPVNLSKHFSMRNKENSPENV
jgi:hypothetical protein